MTKARAEAIAGLPKVTLRQNDRNNGVPGIDVSNSDRRFNEIQLKIFSSFKQIGVLLLIMVVIWRNYKSFIVLLWRNSVDDDYKVSKPEGHYYVSCMGEFYPS